ncbi:THO complex subunit 7 homolog [Halichondria panicea]|uniref:THO complex subunit 7 homolog n=1 Tax=Halichondria panicea TaxID=6063 RepID=UPI00312BC4B7
MSEEEMVMHKRLTLEGEGGSDDKRIMSLVKTFVRWTTGSLSDDDQEATYQKMLFTLGLCEFTISKTDYMMEMNRKEMDRYERVYSEIESNIEAAQQQISDYKVELQQAQIIRNHRQEYNALAKVIQKYPPRQISKDKISDLEQSLSDLVVKKEQLSNVLDLRKKQFHLLVQCVHQLQDELQSDDVAMETE